MSAAALWRRTREVIDDFVHSRLYIAFIAVVAYVLWTGENLLAAMAVLSVIAGIILIAVRDTVPLVPFVVMAPCVVHISEMPAELWQFALAIIPVLAGIVIHVACYRRNKIDRGAINLLPMAAFILALLVSGAFSSAPQDDLMGFVNVLYVGVLPFILYLFVRLYGEEKCRYGDYLAATMVIWGMLTAAQAFTVFAGALAEGVDIGSNSYVPRLGWGNSNVYPTVLMMCMPFNFYYMRKNAKWLLPAIALTAAEFVCTLYAHSRGAMIFTILVLIACVIAVTVYNRKNPLYWAVFAAAALGLVVTLTFFWDRIVEVLGNTFSDKMQSSGRDYLYIEAVNRFFENPLFGAGMGYLCFVNKLHIESGFYQLHSTVFQTIGTMGLVGIAAMLWLYIARYYTVFSRLTPLNVFFFVAMIGFEGYSLVNTSTFTGLPCLTVIYMFLAVMELDRSAQKGCILLGRTLKELAACWGGRWKKKRA